MHAAALQAKLTGALRIATTAILTALLLMAGWTPARALPTLDLAGQALAAAQAQGSVGFAQRDGAPGNWRVRAPGASQLAARPGPADQTDAAALPGGLPPALLAGLATRPDAHPASALSAPRAAHRARAPPRA